MEKDVYKRQVLILIIKRLAWLMLSIAGNCLMKLVANNREKLSYDGSGRLQDMKERFVKSIWSKAGTSLQWYMNYGKRCV